MRQGELRAELPSERLQMMLELERQSGRQVAQFADGVNRRQRTSRPNNRRSNRDKLNSNNEWTLSVEPSRPASIRRVTPLSKGETSLRQLEFPQEVVHRCRRQ